MTEQSYIFGKGTPWTYEQLQRKREIADALANQIGTPRNVGEGLAAIGKALAARGINKRADARDAELKGEFDQTWNGAFGGGMPGMGGSPGASGGSFAPPDPNSPSQIGADTMAALGKGPDYAKLEATYGLPQGYLTRTRQLESGNNPNAQNPNSSAGGDFQFIDSTARQYGLTDKNDPFASADAAARLGRDNKAALTKALGREPTAGELYLAHQQGAQGAAGLLTNQNAPASGIVGQDAVALNGGDPGMTGGQFANKWLAKFGGQPQDPQMDIGTLAQLAGSPYASPGQKAIASALLQQQMQAMDPMHQMEVQKAQLELDALKNPKADPVKHTTFTGGDGAEYSFDPITQEVKQLTGPKPAGSDTPASFAALDLQARAAGLTPGTPEYKDFMRNGGGAGVPAAFASLDLQAKAAGFTPGTQEYKDFMATRGAGLIAAAKAEGADSASLESLSSKMPSLEKVVSELDTLSNEATYTGAGKALDWVIGQTGMAPRNSAVARAEYIAKVDNQILPLLRDTFGAQFTVKEGETLRSTLGDPDKTPAEKQVVLKAFIEQKRRDVDALKVRTGKAPAPANGGQSDADYLKSLGLE